MPNREPQHRKGIPLVHRCMLARSRTPKWLGAASFVTLFGGIAEAPAFAATEGTSPVSLTWTVPTDTLESPCPSREQMLVEIERVLGPATGPRKSVTARGRIEQRKRDFRVTLELVTEEARSERSVQATSCLEAAGAAALIVALTVDENVRPPESAPFSEPSIPAPSPPTPTPAPSPTPPEPKKRPPLALAPLPTPPKALPTPSAEPRRTLFRAGVAGSGALESGTLPSATGGAQITAFGAASFLRAEGELSVFAPRETTVVEPAGRGGTFSAFTVGGRVCALATYGRLSVGPCGAVLFVKMTATGLGTADVRTETATWGGLGGDAVGLVRIGGPMVFRVRFGGVGALDRPSFVLDSGGTRVAVHRPAASSFTGSMGVELHFY